MKAVSQQFLDSIRTTHSLAVRARIVGPGQTGVDPRGTDVPVLDGDVELDATAEIRGSVDVTVHADWPQTHLSPATPYGNELFIERGVNYGNGSTELVPLGYFRIDTVEQETLPDGPLRISGQDRMTGLVEAKLVQPIQFSPNHTIQQVIEKLVFEVYPHCVIEYDFSPDAIALNRSQIVEKDRYEMLDDVVRSLGRVMYFDHRGVLVITTPPDPGDPVFTVDRGAVGVMTSVGRQLGREGIYNGVVAEGEGADNKEPIRKTAVDLNSNSPTYWFGPFGQVVKFFSSPIMTDGNMTQRAANYELKKTIGLPYTIDLESIPNPALEPLDPITVRHPAGDEIHIVDAVTIPLTVDGSMRIRTRQQSLDAAGSLGGGDVNTAQ